MIRGYALKYGDNIDTDAIIPARYATHTEIDYLGQHCMEDLDKDFLNKRKPGDIIVAGENFGCGSSREIAPLSIMGANISCIIAASFARIFYRNAINVGLFIFESDAASKETEWGDILEVDPGQGLIKNLMKDRSYPFVPFPPVIQEIIENGGLVSFINAHLEKRKRKIDGGKKDNFI